MTAAPEVRRVRVHEWREIRDLRIEAVTDPDAAIAFLSTLDQERAHDDAYWRQRAAGSALGENTAQFVAIDDERWVGTATALVRDIGSEDHLARTVTSRRADIVGVYVAPERRGTGLLARLVRAAAEWARASDVAEVTLDVHADNLRAQAAYRKLGFAPTGETLTGPIGPEVVMRLAGSVAA